MNKIKHFLITGFILLIAFLPALPAAAQLAGRDEVELSPPIGSDILPGGQILEAENIKTSFVFSKLIPFLITYAIRLAVALSVIAIIIGGYQYMTAYGNEEKHKAAQKTITYAVIGLIIAIMAYGLVKIITSLTFI